MLDSSAEEHQTDLNCRYHQSEASTMNHQKGELEKEGQSKQDMTRVTRQRSSPLSDKGISRGALARCRHHTSGNSFLVAFWEKQGKPQGGIDQF
jgi:hypothetical protein